MPWESPYHGKCHGNRDGNYHGNRDGKPTAESNTMCGALARILQSRAKNIESRATQCYRVHASRGHGSCSRVAITMPGTGLAGPPWSEWLKAQSLQSLMRECDPDVVVSRILKTSHRSPIATFGSLFVTFHRNRFHGKSDRDVAVSHVSETCEMETPMIPVTYKVGT